VRSSQQAGAHINSVSFNPYDPSILCITGNGIFKLFRYSEGQLKPISFKVEPRVMPRSDLRCEVLNNVLVCSFQNYLCHAWISEERMIVGSEDSLILIFDDGEVRGELLLSADNETRRAVHSLVGFSKGFVCGTNNGNIFVYERSEDPKEFYKKIRQFTLPEDGSRVVNMTLSPNEDNLLCSTDANQLYYIGFGSTEIIKVTS
jgi:WD40 repeat protein